jgi:hypothetical protein
MKKQARERLECYKKSLMVESGGNLKTRMLIRMRLEKMVLLKFQIQTRTLMRTGLDVICVTL